MTEEPVKIAFKRWRHKGRGYIVHVVSVLNYQGKHGFFTSVSVQQKGHRPTTWPAETFLRTFEPAGRRIRKLTRWQRLEKDPDSI